MARIDNLNKRQLNNVHKLFTKLNAHKNDKLETCRDNQHLHAASFNVRENINVPQSKWSRELSDGEQMNMKEFTYDNVMQYLFSDKILIHAINMLQDLIHIQCDINSIKRLHPQDLLALAAKVYTLDAKLRKETKEKAIIKGREKARLTQIANKEKNHEFLKKKKDEQAARRKEETINDIVRNDPNNYHKIKGNLYKLIDPRFIEPLYPNDIVLHMPTKLFTIVKSCKGSIVTCTLIDGNEMKIKRTLLRKLKLIPK